MDRRRVDRISRCPQAYRKLAAKMHPDKNKDDPDANEKFAEIGNGACARSACTPLCLRCGFGSAPAAALTKCTS